MNHKRILVLGITLSFLIGGCEASQVGTKGKSSDLLKTSDTTAVSKEDLPNNFKNDTSKLINAASSGNAALVKELLDQGVNANVTDLHGATPLINCAFSATNPHAKTDIANEIATLLLQHEANPNIQDSNGDTALFFAASANDLEMVKLLLNAGANPNLKNKSGITAMDGIDPNSSIGQLLLRFSTSANSTDTNTSNNETPVSWTSYQAGQDIETFSAPKGWQQLFGAVSANNDGVWKLDNSGDKLIVTGNNSQNKYIANQDYVHMYNGDISPFTLSNGKSAAIYQYSDGKWQHYGVVTIDGNHEMDFCLTESYLQSNKDTLTKVLQSFNVTTSN